MVGLKSGSIRGLKGQAAMEYLMTYGWAILVIVIVLAVLLFLNPFKAPETCLFQQPGFSCSEVLPIVYTDGGQTFVSMKLANKLGQNVKIHEVVCTTASIGDVKESTFDGVEFDPAKPVGAGASGDFSGPNTVPCVGADGNTQLNLNQNSQFKGVIAVWYNYDNDPEDIHRQAFATLVTTVLVKS